MARLCEPRGSTDLLQVAESGQSNDGGPVATSRNVAAVVPFRDVLGAKSRLSPALNASARAELAIAMLADTVTTLQGAGVDVLVAAGTFRAARVAAQLEVPAIVDAQSRGLRQAVDEVISSLDGDIAVVMPDLPLLRSEDVHSLLASDTEITVAPTSDRGTGAILMAEAVRFGTCFGPRSAEAHVREAASRGLSTSVIRRYGWSLDVDTPADLERAIELNSFAPFTRKVVVQWLTHL